MNASEEESVWRIAFGIAALATSTGSGEELACQIRLVYPNEPLYVLRSATYRASTLTGVADLDALERLDRAAAILDGLPPPPSPLASDA